MQETQIWSLVQEDPLKKGMATHSSTPAWRIPWTEEPDKVQSMGLQRARHDLATKQQQRVPAGDKLIFTTEFICNNEIIKHRTQPY